MTTAVTAPTVLSGVREPADVRRLPRSALPALADDIRRFLIDAVPRTGGHLGPNLGAVELTIALHRVFESPRDALVFDTGHQAYVHKLLTGRADGFDRLRQCGGLSGYPNRAESEHDLVENSHASTALSYADGLAKAFAVRERRDRAVVAVVGDGALTGGMCWEALNNIGGAPDRPVVVVLNDNGRSYSPTVGALAGKLERARDGTGQGTLFTELGFGYVGPVDGHDIGALESALRRARALNSPVIVHCVTTKGKGHPPAEADEVDHQHTVSPPSSGTGEAWTHVFSDELIALGQENPELVAITAAMLHPTGLHEFARKFPDRVYDVGIAEQHAVTSAAGLATGGLHPVVCVYATFLSRAFDQVLLDVGLHRLPVTFVLDRAGITGNDGPSHHGMWDMSLLGIVPGLRLAAPRDATRLRALLAEAVAHPGPAAIRFPKGTVSRELPRVGRIGRADVLAGPDDRGVLVVAAGSCAEPAVTAAERIDGVTVVDPRWPLPVDDRELLEAAARYRAVLTVEDNGTAGGFGDAFARALREAGISVPLRTLGLPQRYLPHARRAELLAEHHLDADGICTAIAELAAAVSGRR